MTSLHRFCLCGWLLLSFCTTPAYAFRTNTPAGPLNTDITLTTVVRQHWRNLVTQRRQHSAQYYLLQNKLGLRMSIKEFTAGGQLDTFNFFEDRIECPKKFPNCKGQYIPEKLFLKIRKSNFEMVFGDHYVTVARGLALNLRKVDEFGQDTALRGARISYQDGPVQAVISGGWVNINNLDPVQEIFLQEPNDFIFSAQVSRFFEVNNEFGFTMGAHYVFANLPEQPDNKGLIIPSRDHIGGGFLEMKRLWNRFDFYFEGNIRVNNTTTPNDALGYAFYTNINGYFFPFTIRFEGQWYHRFVLNNSPFERYDITSAQPLVYSLPPSMEHQLYDTQADNSNSKGLRLRLDYTLPSRETIFFVNYMFRYGFNALTDDPEQQLLIHHVFGGGEHRFGEVASLQFFGGFRQLTGLEYWRTYHGNIDTSIHITHRQSIELLARYRWNRRGTQFDGVPLEEQTTPFENLDIQLAYSFSKIGSLAFLYSYSDEITAPGTRTNYVAGELKVLLSRYGFFKVLVGATRGGLRCVSGVCRIFPPFEGVQGELTLRF